MRVPGGGRLLPGCGASGVGRSPTPDCPPSGRAAGAHYPLAVGAGGCGRGDPSPTPQRALLRAGFARFWGRHEGAWGGRLLPGCGASGVGRSPTPGHPFFRACGRGPLPTGRACGVRAWGPGCPWHLLPCCGSSCVVRASRVRGTRWPLWPGTCPRAVVVDGGVPLWRASWPRFGAPLLVLSGCSRCSGRLPLRRGAFPHPGGCRPRLYWVAARGRWRLAANRAHCACRWPLPRQGRWARSALYPFGAPRWGCPWRVPPASVFGCVRCAGLACVDPVTDASGFPYSPSCDGGLGWCTGAVSCGRQHRPFRVRGRHARVPRVCACACLAWPGRPVRPPGRVLVRLTFNSAVPGSLFACSALSGLGLPCLWLLLVPLFLFPFSPSLRPRCFLLCVLSGPGCLGPWRLVPPPLSPPPLCPPRCLLLCVFSGLGCPWPWRLVAPPPFVLCAAVWCCAVVPCLLFWFFSLLVALVSCCSLLVLGSGPVPGRFCFCALPVRCSLALAGLAGVLCCCLLCLCVCCWAWLSSVVSWWVLVAPGVVSRWRALVCPWVLCCAVLLRVVPPGVALLCAVLFRFAPFGAAARCFFPWGAVGRLGVLCRLAPCFVLFPHAVCVLLLCVAAWCFSPLCFVPCAPWGVVLCVSCRLRPLRC